MDHVVYLDYKSKELENLKNGIKSMIIRGAMGRKLPYGKAAKGDRLFFIENKGDGYIKACAVVSDVFNSDPLSKEASAMLVEKHQRELLLDTGMLRRFSGKRYLVLISVRDFRETDHFKIDKSEFANMDDWLPVGDIEKVKTK